MRTEQKQRLTYFRDENRANDISETAYDLQNQMEDIFQDPIGAIEGAIANVGGAVDDFCDWVGGFLILHCHHGKNYREWFYDRQNRSQTLGWYRLSQWWAVPAFLHRWMLS